VKRLERRIFNKPPCGLFVTGTDTGVGKTYVASLIARDLRHRGSRVGVYKPAATGCRRGPDGLIADDAVSLWQAAGRPGPLDDVCPQRFHAPLAPHLAARAENSRVSKAGLKWGLEPWADRCDVVIVEGVGGLLSPLAEDQYVADLARDFSYPLVVVAPNVLGVINQTLQTLLTAATYGGGLAVAGVVLNDVSPNRNDPSQQSNLQELARRCHVPVVAYVGWQSAETAPKVNWMELATGSGQGSLEDRSRNDCPISARRDGRQRVEDVHKPRSGERSYDDV
jgi:dethiobiotin synthetase